MEKKYGCVTIKCLVNERDVKQGGVYSALIDRDGDARILNDLYDITVLMDNEYEILSDDRCEFYPTQEVEVSDDGEDWRMARFLAFLSNANLYKYLTVLKYSGTSGAWKYCRPIEEPKQTELTLEQIAQKFDIPVSQLRIKE